MPICAFFGHRDWNYSLYESKITERIVDLIENRNVTEFYSGGRGNFDNTCAKIVWKLKRKYPYIKNILVLSNPPEIDIDLPDYYDKSVYLLQKIVPPKYCISRTNRKMVEMADYIISGVILQFGGAKKICDYAEHLCKTIFYVVDGRSYCDYDWVIKAEEEAEKNEEYRKRVEEEKARFWEKLEPILEEIFENYLKNRKKDKDI